MAAPSDAELEALEKELEQYKSDAARQLDELAALTQAADAGIADTKRETHEVRLLLQPRGGAERCVGRPARSGLRCSAQFKLRVRRICPARATLVRVNAA